MSVRTYNSSVLIGNWNEDVQLEQDLMKDFLEKREKGELQTQQTFGLTTSILKQVELSVSRDGYVHYGDTVMIMWPGNNDEPAVLAINMSASKMHTAAAVSEPCGISGSTNKEPGTRNTFMITSVDGKSGDRVLAYGEPFSLVTTPATGGSLLLHSDRASFQKCAKKSRLQEVSLTNEASFGTQWKVAKFDPQCRLEFEGTPVPSNERVLITHLRTNQNLALMSDHSMRTVFGREFEISAKTMLDSHKAETMANHWMFYYATPAIIHPEMTP